MRSGHAHAGPSRNPGVGPDGFTLLEMLIALAVFAIMAVMAYSGLKTLLDVKAAAGAKAERLGRLQTALLLFSEDLSHYVERPVRDEFGAVEPAFKTGQAPALLSLTRAVSRPSFDARLARISYRWESGALYRQVWNVLDRTQQSTAQRRRLIEAESVALRYWDGEWRDYWDAAASPKAVELTLTIPGFGVLSQLVYLHG